MGKVGSKEFLDRNGIKAWATVPREVILRNMAPDKCLDTRLLFAMILWSWCGPAQTETVVRKNEHGWILPDRRGNHEPARLRDFAEMLGVSKANITRAVQRLKRRNELRSEGRALVLTLKPPSFAQAEELAGTVKVFWNIAGEVVHLDNLTTDPVEMEKVTDFLNNCSTNWKQQLRDVRTSNRELLRAGLSALGHPLKKSKKSLKEEQTDELSAAPVVRSSVALSLEKAPPLREKIRKWLTERYGEMVPTALQGKPLDELAGLITDDTLFDRFERQVDQQKPRPKNGWMLFVSIARSCAQAQAASDEERTLSARDTSAQANEWKRSQEEQRRMDEQVQTEAARIEQEMGSEFEMRVLDASRELQRSGKYPRMSRDHMLNLAREIVRGEIRNSLEPAIK